jgi:hypothetical protein
MNNGRASIHGNGQSNVAPRCTLLGNTPHQRIFNVIMSRILVIKKYYGQMMVTAIGFFLKCPTGTLASIQPDSTRSTRMDKILGIFLVREWKSIFSHQRCCLNG